MENATFNVIMTSGDIFQYSIQSTVPYVEMWDTKVKRTYDWKWSTTSYNAWDNWGGGSRATSIKSFSFNSSTGKFSYTYGETKYLMDLRSGEILYDNRNISHNAIMKVDKVTEVSSLTVRVSVFCPEVFVKSEQKIKGDSIIGLQFAVNEGELLRQGINEYMQKEYYCEKKK